MKTFSKKRLRNVGISITSSVIFFTVASLNAQNNTDGVRLFQSFFYDTPISERPFVQGGLQYSKYEHFSMLDIGAMGGYGINEKIEVQAGWSFVNFSPEEGDGKSGISDLALVGRYKLANSGPTNFATGAMITLPIGSDKVGGGNLNFGGFGAVRHALDNGLILCGTLGLFFYETTSSALEQTGTDEWGLPIYETDKSTKHETSLNIGAGAIGANGKHCVKVGRVYWRGLHGKEVLIWPARPTDQRGWLHDQKGTEKLPLLHPQARME